MKKPLIALSFAVASALALADSAQYKQDWFKGIGSDATLENMKATNGSWEFPETEDCAKVESNALVLDLDSGAEATFTIGGENGDLGETGTEQTLTVTGVFTPIAAEDLLPGATMNEKKAQVGFAVVSSEATAGEGEIATTTTAYKYYAWVGGTGGASAINDWVELTDLGAASATEEVALKITINYWNEDEIKATFAIGEKTVEKTLSSTAMTNKKIASVSCTGSGTLNALSGAYQYAVAEAEGKKYPTLDAAIAAAQATGGSGNVKMLKAVSGDVANVAGGVTIETNGNTAPTITIDETKDNSKEVATDESAEIVVVQTKKTILDGVMVGGTETSRKGLMTSEAGFRKFLNKHCKEAYTKANTDAEAIQNALNEVNGTTKRPLWQSYVLGLEPSDALTLKPAAKDDAEDKITLALPIKPTGDFTVTCKVGDGEAQTLTAEKTSVAVPLETGHYAVKITLE